MIETRSLGTHPPPVETGEVEAIDFPFRDVVVLTQYYAPEPGAPQVRLRAMVRELRRAGVRVRVVTGMPNYPTGAIFDDYRGRLVMHEEVDGVTVRRVWLYPAAGRGSAKRLLNYLSFTVTGLLALLRERRADLIFVEAQPITLALSAWIVGTLRGIPYIYNTPDLQVEHAQEAGWLRSDVLVEAARRLEAFLMRRALSTTTVTHAFVEHFIRERGVDPDRMSFLPNGADTEWLRPRPRDASLAERLGVGDRTVFTYAGTHAPYQGLEVIVEAAERLRHREDIVILMVGKGPVRDTLIEQARVKGLTNIRFEDSPFDEMDRLMSLTYASIVVLKANPTSEKMRLSKTIPPLACGVPVLFAGHGESAEIVREHGCGLTLEPGNPAALVQAMVTLTEDPALRRTMSHMARRLAERSFSWEFLVRDWMRQIGAVATGRPPRIPGFAHSG